METKSTWKRKRLMRGIHGIVYTLLIIAVIIQYRQNTELKRELNKAALSEKGGSGNIIKEKSPGLKFVKPTSQISGISEEDISDKEKIKKLESRIADMQAWQNYLEETLEKQKQEDDRNNEMEQDFIKATISSRIDGFAEEASLSRDIEKKLFNILFEKEMEIEELFSGDISQEDRKQEMEYLTKKYDELISELLAGNYAEYKDYMKEQMEREYITDFKNSMLRDIPLEKQQEKRLISAIYTENQNFKELLKEKNQLLHSGEPSGTEILREELKLQKMLYNRYIDCARDILSESQLKKFKKYLDVEISQQEINVNRNTFPSGDRDKNETD